MTENEHEFGVSDVEYNVITTLATLLQSEDVLQRYTEDAEVADEHDIAELFVALRKHNKEIAKGLRAVLTRNLTT